MSAILLTSYYTIQNPATGGKRRVTELVRALQPDVFVLQPPPLHPEFTGGAYPLDCGRRKRGINWGMFNLYWPANRRTARQTAATQTPQVLLATSIWCHDAYSGLGIPRVLDAQNVDGHAIAERFGPGHPFTRLVRAQERRVTRQVERIFCCSDTDAELFRRDYGIPADKILVAPNGVRPSPAGLRDPQAEHWAGERAGRCYLFFMGKLDYAPNQEALAFIANDLLPELERHLPGRFLCLVSGGPRMPSGIRHPLLHYVGQVPEIAPWLALADICLAPVFSGSGTRLKVLEYLAAGKPVVATAKAAEGLAVADGRELCLAEKPDFAAAVQRLAHEPVPAGDMAERGRQLVQRDYSWERTARIWRDGLAPFLRVQSE